MWPSVLKLVGGSLLAFALVWALVLGWWQSNDFEPNRLDMGLYLGVLPLFLVGGYLLLRGFIEHLKAPPPVAVAEPTGIRDLDPLAQASAVNAENERRLTLRLVNGFVLTAAAGTPEALLAVTEEGKRPGPDAELLDANGFPVFAGRIDAIDADGVQEHIASDQALAQAFSGNTAAVRALALLNEILALAKAEIPDESDLIPRTMKMRVAWITPRAWQDIPAAVLEGWLRKNHWPELDDERLAIDIIPSTANPDAWRNVDEMIRRTNRERPSGELILLIGATSSIDPAVIDALDAQGELFSASRQNKSIPGEGAVAMLLAHEADLEGEILESSVVLSRLASVKRDQPLGYGGRIRGRQIAQLASGMLDFANIEPAAIGAVVLDSDHRADYRAEALEGIGSVLDHLDPLMDCPAIATSCGDLSPIGGLLALACARARCLEKQLPVLCLSSQHPVERSAFLLTPHQATPNLNPIRPE